VGPRAVLDAVVKRKIPSSHRESKRGINEKVISFIEKSENELRYGNGK
jgi:hypothetical protein